MTREATSDIYTSYKFSPFFYDKDCDIISYVIFIYFLFYDNILILMTLCLYYTVL